MLFPTTGSFQNTTEAASSRCLVVVRKEGSPERMGKLPPQHFTFGGMEEFVSKSGDPHMASVVGFPSKTHSKTRAPTQGFLKDTFCHHFETCCFFSTQIKLETSIYKLQCSGVCKDPCFWKGLCQNSGDPHMASVFGFKTTQNTGCQLQAARTLFAGILTYT